MCVWSVYVFHEPHLLKVTWQRYVDPKSNLIVLAKKRNEGFHWLQQRFMANTLAEAPFIFP